MFLTLITLFLVAYLSVSGNGSKVKVL